METYQAVEKISQSECCVKLWCMNNLLNFYEFLFRTASKAWSRIENLHCRVSRTNLPFRHLRSFHGIAISDRTPGIQGSVPCCWTLWTISFKRPSRQFKHFSTIIIWKTFPSLKCILDCSNINITHHFDAWKHSKPPYRIKTNKITPQEKLKDRILVQVSGLPDKPNPGGELRQDLRAPLGLTAALWDSATGS